MPQTIMIGANDPNTAYLLQRYAEESGFQAVSLYQKEDLLAAADRLQPVLIVLDIALLATLDWEAILRWRAEPTTQKIPIVIYSCLDEPPENWREGIDGFLLKSAMYEDFVGVLERAGLSQRTADIRPPLEPLDPTAVEKILHPH